MKIRIGTLLTVLLACFALTATTACSKKDDDKKNTAKKKVDGKKDDKKKDDKAKTDTKKDEAKKDDKAAAGGDKLKEMHAFADKVIAKSKEMCACKDKACASEKNKEMDAMMKAGEEKFGKKKPPAEIISKLMPAMKAAGQCMQKLSK